MPLPSVYLCCAVITNTAASVMFLLGIGEILEEWTHKKSVGDLARSMSLNVDKVWLKAEGQEILVRVHIQCTGRRSGIDTHGQCDSFRRYRDRRARLWSIRHL